MITHQSSTAGHLRTGMLVVVASLLVTSAAGAQIEVSRAMRWSFGGELGVSLPKGEFDRHTKQGYGLAGHAIYALTRDASIGLRLDASLIGYGYQKDEYPCGTLCRYEATTNNNIVTLSLAPQFFLPTRRFTPYVAGGYGLLWFTTSSEVLDPDGSSSAFRHEVESDDVTGAYVADAGVYVPLGGRFRGIVANIGVRFFGGGEAEYLTGNSVQRDLSGNYTVTYYRSRTEFWLVHIGLSSSTGR